MSSNVPIIASIVVSLLSCLLEHLHKPYTRSDWLKFVPMNLPSVIMMTFQPHGDFLMQHTFIIWLITFFILINANIDNAKVYLKKTIALSLTIPIAIIVGMQCL